MKSHVFILFLYTVSIGNLIYKIGFRNGFIEDQKSSIVITKNSNKQSYEEGCEASVEYNCFVNECGIVPIEILKQYCVDKALEFEKENE